MAPNLALAGAVLLGVRESAVAGELADLCGENGAAHRDIAHVVDLGGVVWHVGGFGGCRAVLGARGLGEDAFIYGPLGRGECGKGRIAKGRGGGFGRQLGREEGSSGWL